jgi:RNA polymerase sigma-70 factor (ECF subfamily)
LPISIFSNLHKNDKDKLFDQLVQKYYNKIFNYCSFRLQQDKFAAEECAQDVFTTLYRNMETLKDFEKLDGWLYKTADNFVNRVCFRVEKERKKLEYFDFDKDHSLYKSLIYEERFDFIEKAEIDIEKYLNQIFAKLTEMEITIWDLYFKQQKTVREVSEQLNLSESAIKSRACRLKRKILVLVHSLLIENE